jgi:uncharacterized protein YidB (DUF937 family)
MSSIFETYTSVLGTTGITPSQFALLVLDLMRTNSSGGLPGLLDRFRDHGFDDAVRSWISGGKNFTLGAQDVERVIGAARIELLAHKAGVPPKAAAAEMASLLPQLVDKLTPGGHLPDDEGLARNFDLLREKIGML